MENKDYSDGVLYGLMKAVELVELYRQKEITLGGIDEANGIYQAKRQILKFIEKYPCI